MVAGSLAHQGIDSPDACFAGWVEITLTDGRAFDSGIVDRSAYQWDEISLEAKFRF